MRFHYWVLRAVPDVVRGEYVNIGVLVGSADQGWAIRIPSSLARAEGLGISPSQARGWLNSLSDAVQRGRANYGWASSMCAICRESHFQFSPAESVIAPDVESAADAVFRSRVFDPGVMQRNT